MQDRYRRVVEIFLLRTAGPYIWVKGENLRGSKIRPQGFGNRTWRPARPINPIRRIGTRLVMSASLLSDFGDATEHFSEVPTSDLGVSAI